MWAMFGSRKWVTRYFGLLFVHGSEARGYLPGTTMMNGEPVDPAAELGNLRRGYQELLTRVNEIERDTRRYWTNCPGHTSGYKRILDGDIAKIARKVKR